MEIVAFAIGIVVLVGFIAMWNAAVGSRNELQRLSRLFWISLSFQHAEFALLGRMSDHFPSVEREDGQELKLYLGGNEWKCIAKGAVSATTFVKVVGFRGDRLLVSDAVKS